MANQAEILEFFEMMTERAARGEFRFVAVGTVGHSDGAIKGTVAGVGTEAEAEEVIETLEYWIANEH